MEVQTEVLNDVPHFDDLFPLYEKEYEALSQNKNATLWNKDILKTKSYHGFMLFHLKELVRLRMIPNDWPKEFMEKAKSLNGEDLLLLAQNSGSEIKQTRIDSKSFKKWSFEDLLFDLYKFQSADELAKKDIPKERLQQYQTLEKLFETNQSQDPFIIQLKSVFKILSLLSNGDPADHFEIDLKKQEIKRL
ncbi:hypothetical protein [Chryseobacterium sp. SIMBA_038]|uniref:hypothetical protein n=1 Tax=Chryseobacterium sp. SIMBA_038 TaxID=3085780 RepID=UPI00397AAF39